MADKGTFTKDDLMLAAQLTKRVLESRFGHLKDSIVQNFREAIDPDLRLAGRVRARYDALREAGFSHEEAVEYTGKSVNKTTETVLSSLSKKKEETCRH